MTLTLDAPRQVGGRYRDSAVHRDCRLAHTLARVGTRQLTRPDSSVCRMPRLGEGAMLETKAGLCRGTIRVARARAVCVGIADRALASRSLAGILRVRSAAWHSAWSGAGTWTGAHRVRPCRVSPRHDRVLRSGPGSRLAELPMRSSSPMSRTRCTPPPTGAGLVADDGECSAGRQSAASWTPGRSSSATWTLTSASR